MARTNASPSHVLVTGSAGNVGRAVAAELLARGYRVRGFDRETGGPAEETVVARLDDRAALDRAMQDVDAVVHLAAVPNDADFLTKLLPSNVVGLYHLWEAAKDAGVRRVAAASSVQVVQGHREFGKRTMRVDEPVHPHPNHYAALKVLLEQQGRLYHEAHGMSVVVVRIGWCISPQAARPKIEAFRRGEATDARWLDHFASRRDIGRLFADAVAAPDIGFEVVFGASRPHGTPAVDMEPARRILGFEPQDMFPEGIDDEPTD